jgi:hypothetical protein
MDEANREDGEEDTSSNMRICIRCTQHKPVTLFAKPGRKELLKTCSECRVSHTLKYEVGQRLPL